MRVPESQRRFLRKRLGRTLPPGTSSQRRLLRKRLGRTLPPGTSSLRRIWSIAYAESSRTGLSFNRKTTITLLAIGLVSALVVPMLTDGGLDFDQGLYRVSASPDSPLLPAVEAASVFRVVDGTGDPRQDVENGLADLGLDDARAYAKDDSKGQAALAALEQAVRDHTFGRLVNEADQAAAFPVRVELVYATQERAPGASGGPSMGGGMPDLPPPEEQEGAGDGTTSGSASGGSDRGTGDGTQASGADDESVPQEQSGGFSFLPPQRSVNTPETLSPPFPFRSLLLAYAFLIPMNFVVQVYAGSAIAERLDRKGEPLLASPARPWEIIVGKATPFLLLMMLVSAGIVVFIGGGWLSLLAVLPLVLAFLSLEFVAAMYARSFRELTFLTVFTSVLLTIYAFLPAVFTDVHPIALVSPITLVVLDLRDQAVPLVKILYATLPLTLFSLIMFVLGAALYREEDLFHQKPVLSKAVDSLARQVKGLASAIKIPVMLLPLVFVSELLLITFLYAWPVPVGVVGIMLSVALVEELFKAAPSYAGLQRGIIPSRRGWLFGALVGVGFWLAEKGFLLASLAGLGNLAAGEAVMGPAGISPVGMPLLVVALLFLAPLALHMVTAGITGWGASQKDRRVFTAAFFLSVTIHTVYNLSAILILNGGLRL